MRSISAQSGVIRAWLVACALAVCVAELLHAQSAQAVRVVPLVRDSQVHVTFELTDGFTPEVRKAIQSGLKTSFTYTVDLRRDAFGWLDRTMATATLTNTVKYDNLKREYALQQLLDGRAESDKTVKDDEELVRTWLTSVVQKPLFPTSILQANREYYVRVSAAARPSNGSILWPFGSGTSGQTKFTFLR